MLPPIGRSLLQIRIILRRTLCICLPIQNKTPPAGGIVPSMYFTSNWIAKTIVTLTVKRDLDLYMSDGSLSMPFSVGVDSGKPC